MISIIFVEFCQGLIENGCVISSSVKFVSEALFSRTTASENRQKHYINVNFYGNYVVRLNRPSDTNFIDKEIVQPFSMRPWQNFTKIMEMILSD